MTWYTEGLKSTPASGTVLADTGQLTEGSRSVALVVSANVIASIRLEVRNAANDTTNISQVFHLSALGSVATPQVAGYVNLASNERVRIVTTAGLLVGEIQASLFVQ